MANNQKIDFTKDGTVKIFNTIQENILEERNLALDRFRRQDDDITTSDQFFLQGKILAEYLRVALDRTDAMLNIAKLLLAITHKNSLEDNNTSAFSDDEIKKQIQKQLSENNFNNDDSAKK